VSAIALAPIIGVSPAIKNATALMERFAPTSLPILLIGATGTGKELFTRHIHQRSGRRGELVDVNCGALPAELAESLLFGHRRGAFTGAVESVSGYLQRADTGTLFLDEVMHLPPSAQVKLLRALEAAEVQPLGSGSKHTVDCRVVSAAQDDIPERLESGLFRRDLFQRIAGILIDLPLLADRTEDIAPLAEHFAAQHKQVLESGAAKVLEQYAWPGNVRELQLTIARAGCLVENGSLPPGAIRDAIALGTVRDRREVERRSGGPERRTHDSQYSWDDLMTRCREHSGDPRRVAASLGLHRSAMYARLKAAGISLQSFRPSGSPVDVRRNSEGLPDDRNSRNS
jgi:DNA-binding NtrC family response regulator